MEEVRKSSEFSEMSLLSLYVYRDMGLIDWLPFTKAAIERNNVAFEDFKGNSVDEVYKKINGLVNESVYSEKRLAQPDEVWNFRRGDGIEKAYLLGSWILHIEPGQKITIDISNEKVLLKTQNDSFHFESSKGIVKRITI